MLMSLLSLCSASTESTMPAVILLMSPMADTWLDTSAYFFLRDLWQISSVNALVAGHLLQT